MNRLFFKSCLLVFYLLLSGCGGGAVTQPIVVLNAESYTNDGLQAFAEDDWSRAQQLFTRALLLYQGVDNQQGVLVSHINLAEVALSLHKYPVSQKHLDAATEIVKYLSLADIQSRITLLYSLNALQQNQLTRAESIIQVLLPDFDGDNAVPVLDNNQLVALSHRTKIAFAQQRDELLWTQRYAEALDISAITSHALQARLLRFQSTLLQREGNYQRAEAKLQQALIEYKSIPFRSGIAATLAELGQLSVMEARWQDSRGYFNRAIAVFRYLKDFDKVSQLTESLVKERTQ